MDNRGMALNLIVFVVTILLGAAFIVLLDDPINQMISQGQSSTSTAEASSGWRYIEQGWQAFPLAVMLLGLLQLIVAANFERGRR